MSLGPPPRKKSRWLRRTFIVLFTLLFVAAAVVSIPALGVAKVWWSESIELVDAHASYSVAHPGWSFPARVITAPTPLDIPPKRLIAEAKARGYEENCKDPGPGQFCGKTNEVVPRQGNSLEPIEIGWLIGPDGEIRFHLPLSDAPKMLLDAIVAAEDREFREHGGVNFSAMVRAAWRNAQEGGYAQGASTLTMQLVRNLDQKKEKTVARKVREMVMAMAADEHLGKDGVLQMYLDAPYLGQRGGFSICGFRAAAWHYFAKEPRELTLGEAATLAAILPSPGKLSPDHHPEEARLRRDIVLDTMAELYAYDVAAAKAEPIATVIPPEIPERYPIWLSATRAWLEANYPVETVYGAGLIVTVGMDVFIQDETDKMFAAKLPYFEGLVGRRKERPLQAAGVLVDVDTGLIRGLYGGNDVTATSFNRATQARRQAGSSFKPMVYAMALDLPPDAEGKPRFTAGTAVPNAPRVFKTPQGNWSPRNSKGDYSSTAALAYGLAWSQNVATASLLELAGGPKALIAFAKKFGIDTSKFPEEMGLALGQGEVTPLEMVQFAGAISNGGHRIAGVPVFSAVDPAGVERISPPKAGEAAVSATTAALTREMMRLVIEMGTGGAARGAGGEAGYSSPAMGKTGTTDGEKDLWFVGATPRYAAAVWLGYDVPFGIGWAASDLAAPLWGWWMNRATRGQEPLPEFSKEPELVKRWVCRVSGKAPGASCSTIGASFVPGTEPKGGCPILHPPPEPEEEEIEGGPPKHESLWKKLAREKAERDAAAAGVPVP